MIEIKEFTATSKGGNFKIVIKVKKPKKVTMGAFLFFAAYWLSHNGNNFNNLKATTK